MHAPALCCAAGMLLILAWPLRASTNYLQNGSFELSTNGTGELTFNTVATDWTSLSDGAGHDGYNFLYASGVASTTGATGASGNVKLWGPGDGSANGLPASSPDGGNFIAADGAFEIGAIQQTLALTVGQEYTLGYWWAGAQQSGFSGITTEGWDVSVGTLTQNSPILTDPSEGFTGWQYQTFTFIANSANPVLSFLAVGTPAGEPPFSLLDGVSIYATPEPASCALIGLGLLAFPMARKLMKK